MAVAALLLASCASSDDPGDEASPSAPTTTAARVVDRCDADLEAALERWADGGFSGAVAITGAAECSAGFGAADDAGDPLTADTVFEIGSVTKTVTAAAVQSLVSEGRVALDDRADRWLPELRGPVGGATFLHGYTSAFALFRRPT